MTDHEQIRELMAIYASTLDTKDYDGVMACFASDASIEYEGHSAVLTGHLDIATHMRRALDPLDGTQHFFTNFLIDIAGDTAHMRCYILAQHWRKDSPGGDTYLAGGKYKVEARRVAGKWQITRIRAGSLWSNGNRSLLPSA